MKTLPFSRPGDTRTHWSITVYTGPGAQRDPRARSVVLFCTHTPCTRVTHTHTPCTRVFFHTSRLASEAFTAPRVRKQLSVNIPGGVIFPQVASSSQSLNPNFHHRCDNQTIRRL